MRTVLLTLASVLTLQAGDLEPIVRSWIVNPATATTTNPALRAVLPNVHDVRVDEEWVYVASAGLSMQSLGPMEANDRPPANAPRALSFRFPRHPKAATSAAPHVPVGVVGVLLNGAPIYNVVSEGSVPGSESLAPRCCRGTAACG